MSASVTRPEETALYLADRCAELEAENAKLREAARWRKWPEESPSESGFYLIGKRGLDYTQARYFHAGCNDWDVTWKKFYWMPQMPLLEVES
jgi:hypothetical protein